MVNEPIERQVTLHLELNWVISPPSSYSIYKRIINYITHIIELPDTSIVKQAFSLSKELFKNGKPSFYSNVTKILKPLCPPLRKWSKCRDVIFDHSLGNTMGAIGGRALAPMFLHPLQYGVANLGKAYCKQYNALQLIKEKYVLSWRQNMANSTKLSFYNSIKKDYKIEKHLYLKKNFTQGKCSHNFELAIINSKLKMVDTKTFLVTNDYANTVTLMK